MNVIPCGTEVVLKLSNLKGVITEISIKFNTVTYSVGYMYQGDVKHTWVNEKEFTANNHEKKKIGFK